VAFAASSGIFLSALVAAYDRSSVDLVTDCWNFALVLCTLPSQAAAWPAQATRPILGPCLYLVYIAFISRLYLVYISSISRLYLVYVVSQALFVIFLWSRRSQNMLLMLCFAPLNAVPLLLAFAPPVRDAAALGLLFSVLHWFHATRSRDHGQKVI
jgi:hypothetical protein